MSGQGDDATNLIPIVMAEIVRLIEAGRYEAAAETAREFARAAALGDSCSCVSSEEATKA